MSTQIECPGCGAKHRVVERMMGHVLRCPRCDEKVRIPTKEELEASLGKTTEYVPDAEEASIAEALPIDDADPLPDRLTETESIDGDVALAEVVAVGDAEDVNDDIASLNAVLPAADEDEVEPPALARKKRDDGELDMTPMVDVTFLLLIFFMVTASFSLQKSIAMPRSQSEQPSTNTEDQEEDDFETVTVEIDEFNGYLIISTEFERECTSKMGITSGLRDAFNASAGGMRLAIVCHEKAKLQSLVDVMDAGTIANYGELQITEVEQLD